MLECTLDCDECLTRASRSNTGTDLESWDVSLSTNNVRVECDVFETLDARTQGFYLGIEGSAGRT